MFKGSQLFFFRDKIEQIIARSISFLGEKSKLRDACEYALTNGGKRVRPLIVFLVAEGLGKGLDVSEAALSAECFHTASLIADDLPCMDDESERRGKPTVHKVFGESVGLLASYALITAGFERIVQNGKVMKEAGSPYCHFSDRATCLAIEAASRSAGILGATGGQFFDLFPSTVTLESIKNIIYQKTITLFEVAFLLGWLFGGGEESEVEQIKQTAYHFGMAFQIADDLEDLVQDEKRRKEISIARFLGREKAYALFEQEMRLYKEGMDRLSLFTPSFEKMTDLLLKGAEKNQYSLTY